MKLRPAKPTLEDRRGLGYWMRRVVAECARAGADFAPDPVHDLRVALRRCRSLAEGLMTVDTSRDWQRMRKSSRRLFRRLGRLRDLQVMMEWVARLAGARDPVRTQLLPLLRAQEAQLKTEARDALDRFDRLHWLAWTRTLPRRARRLRDDGPVFEHLALERWQDAYDLHRRAMRVRSRVALHQVRIGLKRFRYTIENFLPSRSAWLKDLKQLQDLLGDVHDLDVLRGMWFTRRKLFDEATKARWRAKIADERAKRLAVYRAKMLGRNALWHVWRAGLPLGETLARASLAKLRSWASFLDPDFRQAQQVARLAVALYDALAILNGVARSSVRARLILEAAALLHNAGRAKGNKAHHNAAFRLITEFPVPQGWRASEMKRVAVVARYHRGAEPQPQHARFAALGPRAQQEVRWLAGILRLADGLARASRGRRMRLRVELRDDALIICALPFRDDQKSAALLGGRKHLIESVLGRPVIVQPWRMPAASRTASRGPARAAARRRPARAAPSK